MPSELVRLDVLDHRCQCLGLRLQERRAEGFQGACIGWEIY